jgi:hypothetical protein
VANEWSITNYSPVAIENLELGPLYMILCSAWTMHATLHHRRRDDSSEPLSASWNAGTGPAVSSCQRIPTQSDSYQHDSCTKYLLFHFHVDSDSQRWQSQGFGACCVMVSLLRPMPPVLGARTDPRDPARWRLQPCRPREFIMRFQQLRASPRYNSISTM